MKKTLAALIAGVAMLGSVSAVAVDKKVLPTSNAPAAIGPYSQGIMVGDTLYVSGQLPMDPQSGKVVDGSAGDVTRQSMNNIGAILAAYGMTMDNVVMATLYVTDLKEFGDINKAYGEYFKDGKAPARVTVQVAALPRAARIEISVVAVK